MIGGHFRFHGRVRALAVAATKAGLKCCIPENIKVKVPGEVAPAKPEKSEKKPKDRTKSESPKAGAKA